MSYFLLKKRKEVLFKPGKEICKWVIHIYRKKE